MVYFNAQGRFGNVMLIYAAAQGCARKGEPISAYILQEWSDVAMKQAPHIFKDIEIVPRVPDGVALWREKEFSYKEIQRIEGGMFSSGEHSFLKNILTRISLENSLGQQGRLKKP